MTAGRLALGGRRGTDGARQDLGHCCGRAADPDAAAGHLDDKSIEIARKRAADAGVANRVSFEVASAQAFSGTGYDQAATFDCLHDMGDPLGGPPHPPGPRPGRHLAGGRALRNRHGGRQP